MSAYYMYKPFYRYYMETHTELHYLIQFRCLCLWLDILDIKVAHIPQGKRGDGDRERKLRAD